MKLNLLSVVCIVFALALISSMAIDVSAKGFEFDNIKEYNYETKTVKITNAFGLGRDIVEATLNTPQVNRVAPGYRKVAEFTIRPNEDYEDILGTIELYDVRKGMKSIERQLDIKYLDYVDVNRELYDETCYTSTNGSYVCQREHVGTESFKDEVWKDFNNSVKSNKDMTIGIFTVVEIDDIIEWIPRIAGVRVSEWSVWTASLNVDLVMYYDLNETSGDAIDLATGINNGTVSTSVVRGVPGIINDAYFFANTSADVTSPTGNQFNMSLTGEFSTSFWINITQINSGGFGFICSVGCSGSSNWRLVSTATSGLRFQARQQNGTLSAGVDIPIDLDEWVYLAFVVNSTHVNAYKNGTSLGLTPIGTLDDDVGNIIIGPDTSITQQYIVDEFGYWNRTLSSAEVTQLWNDGLGITIPSTDVPVVILNAPADNFHSSSPNISFNYTASDGINITNVTIFMDGVANVTTIHGTSSTVTIQTNITGLSEGNHTWNVTAFNNLFPTLEGNSDTRTFTIDTIGPEVLISSPQGDQGAFSSGINLNLSWQITDINLQSCFYEYGNVNTTVVCSINSTNLLVTNSTDVTLTFYANDTAGNLASNTTTWSYGFVEQNVSFMGNVSETSSQEFELNLTTSINVLSISSILVYDGTADISTSSCTGGNCIITNTIDVSLVNSGKSQLKNFFWNLSIFNGTDSLDIQTSTNQQNVSLIRLVECNATFAVETLNFTAFDESDLSRINPFYFAGTFDTWLGTGDVKRQNSFLQSSTAEVNLCISPDNVTYNVDANIEYNDEVNSTLFNTRNYFFQEDTISNVSQSIPLFLLDTDESTSFILKVQDTDLLPIVDALIVIQRFNPGDGTFINVSIAQTDDNGQTVGFFKTETVDYRFIIKKNGVNLLVTSQQKVVPETAPFTLTFTIGEDEGAPWERFEDPEDLNKTLIFNSTTGFVNYVYADTSTNFTSSRLIVILKDFSGNSTTVCDVNSTQGSAVLVCDTNNVSGTYTASGFITRNGETFLVIQNVFQIQTFSDVVGLLGLFFSWFIILVAAFAFKFNEIAGVWLVTMAIWAVNLIGLANWGYLALFSIAGTAIIITVVLKR